MIAKRLPKISPNVARNGVKCCKGRTAEVLENYHKCYRVGAEVVS